MTSLPEYSILPASLVEKAVGAREYDRPHVFAQFLRLLTD